MCCSDSFVHEFTFFITKIVISQSWERSITSTRETSSFTIPVILFIYVYFLTDGSFVTFYSRLQCDFSKLRFTPFSDHICIARLPFYLSSHEDAHHVSQMCSTWELSQAFESLLKFYFLLSFRCGSCFWIVSWWSYGLFKIFEISLFSGNFEFWAHFAYIYRQSL